MPRRADEPETASNHIRPNRRTTTAPVRTRPGCDPSSPQCQRVVTAITPQISNRCEKSGLERTTVAHVATLLPAKADAIALPMNKEIVLVHSSDLHVDEDHAAGSHHSDGTASLRTVLATARVLRADVVLLAGETFENNQLNQVILERARDLFAVADFRVVILPGNHDPALADSVFVRGGFGELSNVSVLGVTY